MCRKLIFLVSFVLVLGMFAGVASGRPVKINFQQAGGEVPEEYLPDYGEVFGDRGNGWSYGWNRDIQADSRDRGSGNAPDQRYDTLLHLQKAANAIWEIELPNGEYELFLVCGDPSNTDQTNNFDVEGVILKDPDGQAGTGFDFDEFNLTAIVADGRLTIQPAEGSSNCKIMFLDILGGVELVKAYRAVPDDGVLHPDTWANLGWSAGDTAASHDVYFGDNFDDVNAGVENTFQVNQTSTFFVVGFPGFPYPDGLVPGTTYYWRIDEIEADGTTIHKGDVWSFSIPPKTAYNPAPADGAELIAPDVKLSWTAGFGAKLHTVYFGDNFDDVNNAAGGLPQGAATYTPATLKLAKTYYWRVDEFDPPATHKGHVWSFTTQGAVVSLNPSNGAVDVKHTPVLAWSPGVYAASHQVYFGADKDAVKNAGTASPEYKGSRPKEDESYEPGKLLWNTTYYWRVDEVNNVNPDSPWAGPVWSFTIANFLIVDDFEDYDAGENQIWYAWKDGLGYGTPGAQPYAPGNGTGSAVGDESTASYTEETIVHGGSQSMPVFYDNSILKYSEAQKTLTYPRDWTENGVSTLTIWFRGDSANAAETLYVALNGSAVVSLDYPNAAQIATWTRWNIDLKAFADQGVNLANVNTIALGLGNKKTPQAGGSGTMYFDDIRLYPPAP